MKHVTKSIVKEVLWQFKYGTDDLGFESGLGEPAAGKLSDNPVVNGYHFRIRNGQGSERTTAMIICDMSDKGVIAANRN